MPVQGTLKADQLHVAQLTVDRIKDPVQIRVLAALIDTGTAETRAWVPVSGNLWSAETQDALRLLLQSMENDIARSLLSGAQDSTQLKPGLQPPNGIGEHVKGNGSGEIEAPSI